MNDKSEHSVNELRAYKGLTVMYYTAGEQDNESFPMIVSSVNGSVVSGTVFFDTHIKQVRDIHHMRDPWCEEHSEVVRSEGTWMFDQEREYEIQKKAAEAANSATAV